MMNVKSFEIETQKNMECKFKHYLLLNCDGVLYMLSSMLCLTPFLFFPSPLGTNIFLRWTFLFLFLPFLALFCFACSFVSFYFALFLLSHSFARLDILRSLDFVSSPLTKIQQQIISFRFFCNVFTTKKHVRFCKNNLKVCNDFLFSQMCFTLAKSVEMEIFVSKCKNVLVCECMSVFFVF